MSALKAPGNVHPLLPDHTQLPCNNEPLTGDPAQPPRVLLPNHLQLPFRDDRPVENSQEHPQSELLSAPLMPVLRKLYPGDRCYIGRDVGVYFRYTDPPSNGCRAPDWFLVPDVPLLLDGQMRRSYVMWHELEPPLVVIEYASGDGSEERDQTPQAGKFWVYERGVHAAYYAIFVWATGNLEVYHRQNNRLARMEPNERGHYAVAPLDVELGVWQGEYEGVTTHWLRWFGTDGAMLPTPEEEAQKLADENRRLAAKYERLAERVKALGLDPDDTNTSRQSSGAK